MSTDPFTAAELVAAAEGREGTFLIILRDTIAQIEESIRQRVLRDAAALGLDVEALAATMNGAAPVAKTPAKRERTPKARVDVSGVTDIALLDLLVERLTKTRATSKGLAGAFANLDVERVRRVLAVEPSVRLEPNGRTWVRAVRP